jgi:hypothetical protein
MMKFNRRCRTSLYSLLGLGELWAGDLRPGRAFAGGGAPGAPLRIVLSHNPDTTRGIGNLYGMRFNCPPEVSILEL